MLPHKCRQVGMHQKNAAKGKWKMGIDVDLVHNLASGLAAGARNDANRGKHVNQKGWVTKEEMRKDAAYKTIALLVLIFLATILFKILIFFGKLSIKIFGPKLGWAINVVGIILLVVIPVYTMKDAADKQKAEAEATERDRQMAKANFQKQMTAKIDAYRDEVRVKVNALSCRCDDAIAFTNLLETFESNTKMGWEPDLSDEYAKDKIDKAYNACVDAVNLMDAKKIFAYFKNAANKVNDVAEETISTLRNSQVSDFAFQVQNVRDDFVIRHKYSREGMRLNTSFDLAKVEIDADSERCLTEIKALLIKGETHNKINQYIKACEDKLETLVRKDRFRRGDYHVEMFKRKMIPASIGGRVDFDGSYDDAMGVIEKEYRITEQKIIETLRR